MRFIERFSRSITRRVFIRRAMESGLVLGGVLTGIVGLAKPARAWGCSPGGEFGYPPGGCYCAGTADCGADRCGFTAGTCRGGATPRCNFWKSRGSDQDGGYCWCSKNCCVGGWTGYFSCCDCWKYGSSGCMNGNTACICKQRVTFVQC